MANFPHMGVVYFLIYNVTVISLILNHIRIVEAKLQIAIYYEVVRTESIDFIIKLNKTLSEEHLFEQIDLNLIPYGKTKSCYDKETAKYLFRCPDDHGHPGEIPCQTYKDHACALNIIGVNESFQKSLNRETFDFIVCSLKRRNTRFCLDSHKYAKYKDAFDKCVNSEEASRYLVNYGTDTDIVKPPIQKFPMIVFNGTKSITNSEEAIKHLRKEINVEMNENYYYAKGVTAMLGNFILLLLGWGTTYLL